MECTLKRSNVTYRDCNKLQLPLYSDYDKLVKKLKAYDVQPEVITKDLLDFLYSSQHIEYNSYKKLAKLFGEIKHIMDEDMNPTVTYYQDFMYHLRNALIKKVDIIHELGNFRIPKNVVRMYLKLHDNLGSKFLYIIVGNEKTILQIEKDGILNFNNIKKALKICECLYTLNKCKGCCKMTLCDNSIDSEYCNLCMGKAANIIQKKWKECMSNPMYEMCKKRLLAEFTELV